MLAAPGRKERDAQHPAAGDTGDNLDRILLHLNSHDPAAFPSKSRFDYRIVNALDTVMFGDDSMPDLVDVFKPNNLARLAEQLEGISTIIALSAPAVSGLDKAKIHATYSHVVHPGMRGLNNYYRGLGSDKNQRHWRVEERCRRYAEEVIASRR